MKSEIKPWPSFSKGCAKSGWLMTRLQCGGSGDAFVRQRGILAPCTAPNAKQNPHVCDGLAQVAKLGQFLQAAAQVARPCLAVIHANIFAKCPEFATRRPRIAGPCQRIRGRGVIGSIGDRSCPTCPARSRKTRFGERSRQTVPLNVTCGPEYPVRNLARQSAA